jgi:hypothetical protein
MWLEDFESFNLILSVSGSQGFIKERQCSEVEKDKCIIHEAALSDIPAAFGS